MGVDVIRPTNPEDVTALLEVANATGLFAPEHLELLRDMLADYFGDRSDDGNFWITDDDHGPVGVAYCELERMADQVWNLQLIAIHPERQRQGRGRTLLHYVEQALQARGGRLLLVETSGLPDFERTRAFYCKCGYEEEARIRDFYQVGEDKIVYRKALSVDNSAQKGR